VVLLFSLLLFWLEVAAPVWSVDDRKDIREPKARSVNQLQDFGSPLLVLPVKRLVRHAGKEAADINSVDEVPESSWFTNRNFLHRMTTEEFAQGPEGQEPTGAGPWTITHCKQGGISLGFRIRDSKGDVYMLKMDQGDFPEMMSAADVIASKFLYAAGYNVPKNSVVEFDPRILSAKNDLQCQRLDGQKFSMTAEGIQHFLEKSARTKDGKIRAMASKYLDGKPVGPFSYTGVRSDDPNDRIPHEHRRELRGLRVIMAFLNDDDIRENNTLDMYVEENQRHFLRHNLIDFGNSLGSATNRPKNSKEGFEYHFDPGEFMLAVFTFGLDRPPHRELAPMAFPSIGNFTDEDFQPEQWKSNLPNPAFENLTDRDGYWGAKIVAAFNDEQIAAAVHSGGYSDPEAERRVIEILRNRRDRTANYWFRRIAPLDRFHLEGNDLSFADLAIEAGLDRKTNVQYDVVVTPSGLSPVSSQLAAGSSIPLQIPADSPVDVRITRLSQDWPKLTVRVQVQAVNGNPTVVRIDR
jgi:hypothetical protein